MAGRPSPSFLRPSAGFHEFLRARGDDVIGVAQLRCLGSACPHSPPVWREEQTTDTVGVASGLGEAFIKRNNKIVSKGDDVSKINRGIWCPRCAARVVKEGQCSGRKGPGKGRSPAAARAPLSGPEREGQRLLQRLRPPSGHGTSGDDTARHPGPSAVYGCGSCSLNAPFLDPRGHQRACTGKRPVSRGEAHSAYNSGGDEAPFTSGVCLITRRQTWLLQRPSSLTHPLPSGAW